MHSVTNANKPRVIEENKEDQRIVIIFNIMLECDVKRKTARIKYSK